MQEYPKYYTPELDEFCNGFEFEENVVSDIWKETFFRFNWFENLEFVRKLDKKEIRVKYLDKEDIESILNVKKLKGDDIELNFQKIIREDMFFEFDYNTENKILIIERFLEESENNWDYFTMFSGHIKNKSELKKLLKQLDIE